MDFGNFMKEFRRKKSRRKFNLTFRRNSSLKSCLWVKDIGNNYGGNNKLQI